MPIFFEIFFWQKSKCLKKISFWATAVNRKSTIKKWTLEHWNTLVQSQNWGSYLEVWQLGKSRPCSSIQFFALSALMLTNGGVVNDTDARYRSLSIKLSKIPYTGLTPHPAVLSRPHLPIGHRAPSDILLFSIDFRY